MTLHCARCGKTLYNEQIVIARAQIGEVTEMGDVLRDGLAQETVIYYCRPCMRCVE